jgi:hypothetical protein
MTDDPLRNCSPSFHGIMNWPYVLDRDQFRERMRLVAGTHRAILRKRRVVLWAANVYIARANSVPSNYLSRAAI